MGITSFTGIQHYGESLLSDQLTSNFVEWTKWCFLGIGAFTNVGPASGAYGGTYNRLRLSEDPNYVRGRVWEGIRHNWVWESGINYHTQPTRISGVTINGTFYDSSTTGVYAHIVDYPNGQIRFNSPISPSSVVSCNYSYRHVNVYSSESPWFKSLMYHTLRADNPQFLQEGSGQWSFLSQNRVQLPAVIIETVPRFSYIPHELGGGQEIEKDINCLVLTETSWDRNQICDILMYQNENRFALFDRNLMRSQNKFPLNFNGAINPTATTYPEWIRPTGEGGFFWKNIDIVRTVGAPLSLESANLFGGVIRYTANVVMGSLLNFDTP